MRRAASSRGGRSRISSAIAHGHGRRDVVRVRRDRDRDRRSTSVARSSLRRASRRYRSAALALERAPLRQRPRRDRSQCWSGSCSCTQGYPRADSVAALFVAVLVLLAAARLMQRNVDVLMDRAPADAEEAARAAIAGIEPPVDAQAAAACARQGRRQFVDVVIGVPPGAAVAQGHAAADGVEEALNAALPEAATSSSTSSRRRTRPRFASARMRPRSACRACARCTTSASSTSAAARRCRCT